MAIKLRLFEPVETTDDKMSVRQFGFVMERPNDVRGDSVNVIAVGGRFDAITEFAESRKQAAADSVKKAEEAKPSVKAVPNAA
jgi:hypothetical protein